MHLRSIHTRLRESMLPTIQTSPMLHAGYTDNSKSQQFTMRHITCPWLYRAVPIWLEKRLCVILRILQYLAGGGGRLK